MIRRGHQLAALAAATAMLLGACSSSKSATEASTQGTTPTADTSTPGTGSAATTDTAPAPAAWTAPVDNCADPEAAKAPITGTLTIGSAMPLSGSPAVAFAPVKDGFELYLKYANDNKVLPGITLKSDIRDDQYDATQTPGVVSTLIDAKVNIFSSIIGTWPYATPSTKNAFRNSRHSPVTPRGEPTLPSTHGSPERWCPTTSRLRCTPPSSRN